MSLLHRLALIGGAVAALAAAGSAAERDAVTLRCGRYAVSFSTADGSIAAISGPAGVQVPLAGGVDGLWRAEFQGGAALRAAEFSAASPTHRFSLQAGDGHLALTYACDAADVTVLAEPFGDGVDLIAEVLPHEQTLLSLTLPAAVRFSPDDLMGLVFPTDGNRAVGVEFTADFFRSQSQGRPARWDPEVRGPAGYVALFGAPLDQRAVSDPPVRLRVTADGRAWLGDDLAGQVDGASAVVNRPPADGQADVVLVDSANGPYLSAARLGGSGLLWRVGGGVGARETDNVLSMMSRVFGQAALRAADRRPKAGVIALAGGPVAGGWSAVRVDEWLPRLAASEPVRDGRAELIELTGPAEIAEALESDEFSAILNPYGEWLPVVHDGDPADVVAAVGDYVRRGGHWLETGGYSFYYALRPWRFLSREERYPAAFADFMQLGLRGADVSLYRVQPRIWPVWEGSSDPSAAFVPGHIRCGADGEGGYVERGYNVFVPAGAKWTAPRVRLAFGRDAFASVGDYCAANAIERPLADKVPPDVLRKLKESVLVYYAGTCAEKERFLTVCPCPRSYTSPTT